MRSIPMLVVFTSGNSRFYEGTLFQLPPELRCKEAEETYSNLYKEGWHPSYMGYESYVSSDGEGNTYIFPCLRIKNSSVECEEIDGYDYRFDRTSVEEFAESAMSLRKDLRAEVEEDANILVHDLRKLNSSVYNKAYACQQSLLRQDYFNANKEIKTVLAAIKLLKLRTDTLDLTSNLEREIANEVICTSDSIKEVIEAFGPSANQKNVRLIFSALPNVFSKAHELFQLVPYIILDNAVKYAPAGTDIQVSASVQSSIVSWDCVSTGPLINADESDRIFNKGLRGANAIKSKAPGNGYGLFLANLLTRRFDGAMHFSSKELYTDERGVIYASNLFGFSIPTAFSKKPGGYQFNFGIS